MASGGMSSFLSSNNNIHLSGELIESMVFDHESYGEKFYSTIIRVQRTSGCCDEIRLCISERYARDDTEYKGKFVVVEGQVRTYRIKDQNGSHVMVYVFAKSMYVISDNPNENNVRMNGYICKVLPPRHTPKGKAISDIILAVNRDYNKSDYIPCICWGINADKAYEAGVGANVDLVGRLQSRAIKDNTRIVYEVSVGNLRIVG